MSFFFNPNLQGLNSDFLMFNYFSVIIIRKIQESCSVGFESSRYVGFELIYINLTRQKQNRSKTEALE